MRLRKGFYLKITSSMRGEEGFTLAELMVMTLIMLILAAGVGGMITSGAKSNTTATSLVKMEDAANDALNTITRQIRVATYISPESNGSSIIFSGDLGGDGIYRTQAFLVENRNLLKDGAPWVEGVDAITFTYYYYDRAEKEEKVLPPGSFPGWNEAIDRVDIRIDMSYVPLGIDLSRTYYGSVTIMNALRSQPGG